MAIERERKFLYAGKDKAFGGGSVLQQGYLMLDGDRQLRVRIVSSESAYICYKQSLNPTDKIEIEHEISLEEGEQLFATALHSLTKVRWKTTFQGNNVDIDLYESGLCVVEIEYENELTELPNYCGEEITGIKEYSNIAIAIAETKKRNEPTIEITSTEDDNIVKVTVTKPDGGEHSFKVFAISEDKLKNL